MHGHLPQPGTRLPITSQRPRLHPRADLPHHYDLPRARLPIRKLGGSSCCQCDARGRSTLAGVASAVLGTDADHLHLLVQLADTESLPQLIQRVKAVTARALNQTTSHYQGTVWGIGLSRSCSSSGSRRGCSGSLHRCQSIACRTGGFALVITHIGMRAGSEGWTPSCRQWSLWERRQSRQGTATGESCRDCRRSHYSAATEDRMLSTQHALNHPGEIISAQKRLLDSKVQ